MSKPIRDASTVVIAREGDSGGVEVFLVKRNAQTAFGPGMYVFPGGRVDAADYDPASIEVACGLSPAEASAQLNDHDCPDDLAVGLHLAAIRECFEEAGVLFARQDDGAPFMLDDHDIRERFDDLRHKVHEGELSLADFGASEGLHFDISQLIYFAHWITPEFEVKRYDTRFFLAIVPPGQEPLHDDKELVASEWISPAEALTGHAEGRFPMLPPTFRILDDMARCDTLDALVDWARAERPFPMMPSLSQVDGRMAIVLPGDAEHPHPQGVSDRTRVILKGQHWSFE